MANAVFCACARFVANSWFVSSSAWPCEQADVQNRRRVLTLLTEKTSYRDTLEVLTNLPGLREPIGRLRDTRVIHVLIWFPFILCLRLSVNCI